MAGATHIVADGLFCRLLKGLEGVDAFKECILATRVVFIEDVAPHPEPILFVHGVVEEYGKKIVRE